MSILPTALNRLFFQSTQVQAPAVANLTLGVCHATENAIVNTSLWGKLSQYGYSALGTLGSLLSTYNVLNMTYRMGCTQRVFKRFCPGLAIDRYAQEKKLSNPQWIIGKFFSGFKLEGMPYPHDQEIAAVRKAFYQGSDQQISQIQTLSNVLNTPQGHLIARATLVDLLPQNEQSEVWHSCYYKLWANHQDKPEDLKVAEVHMNIKGEKEVFSMDRFEASINQDSFQKDWIFLPCLDEHDSNPMKNSFVWGCAVIQPKTREVFLMLPTLARGSSKKLDLERRIDTWSKNLKELMIYLSKAKNLNNPENWTVKIQDLGEISDECQAGVLAIDAAHTVVSEETTNFTFTEKYLHHLPLRRFEMTKAYALNKPISPMEGAISKRAEQVSTSVSQDDGSVAARVKERRRQKNVCSS